eukprot:CAMPEP_0184489664 /NCGR_PEP_ID=MMETSP0113_2-20130426/16069_1 /TAXON_ID=91329 /ORGANISM="Norrisiella sphaerica, Strain BC52" /LENGTH=79 /DNA_ID=CAMNT_0026873217 /DNA_START=41 /DNA_END=280 /DNA_ORIENTATION=+
MNKGTFYLFHLLQLDLEALTDIVRVFQCRLLVHHNVNLHQKSLPEMVAPNSVYLLDQFVVAKCGVRDLLEKKRVRCQPG